MSSTRHNPKWRTAFLCAGLGHVIVIAACTNLICGTHAAATAKTPVASSKREQSSRRLPQAPQLGARVLPQAGILEGVPPRLTTTTVPASSKVPVTPCRSWTLGDALFSSASSELTPVAVQDIKVWATKIPVGVVQLHVAGFTDKRPVAGGNLALSKRRAEAVAKALTTLPAIRNITVTTEGRGDAEPVDLGQGVEALARNRRVEVYAICRQ
jgi:outer membrane protein OmpA-like peptidoglycan-associated protein